ncbi:putative ABC transporter component [Oceanicaulis sp. HTCC2633]|nr:putative ABC transporter component [Oceanicaulis sp. HTCC2633]
MSAPYFYRSNSNALADALFDLREGLERHTLWVNLGLQEVKQLYRGSLLGAAWIVVSFLIFGGGLIWFFGALSSTEASWFAAYLLIGLWVYQFIATAACTVLIAAEGWLTSLGRGDASPTSTR